MRMQTRMLPLAILIITATSYAPTVADVALIPREILFGNPDRAGVSLSPDGKHIAFLADLDGVMNVWVAPTTNPDKARPITRDADRGIRTKYWAYTNDHVLYLQDKDGDENWRVYSANIHTGEQQALTPEGKVQARIQELSRRFPNEMLVSLNERTPAFHDIYRVDLRTGERSLLLKNDGYQAFLTNDEFEVRMALRGTPTGGRDVYLRNADGEWKLFAEISQQDALTTAPAGFTGDGKKLYMLDSRGRNTAALTLIDLDTNESEIITADERADISGVLAHPTEKTVQAAAFTYLRKKWTVIDPTLKKDFAYLASVEDADFEVTSRTLDDQQWIVAYLQDDGPVRYYHYDRTAGKAKFLFTNRAELEDLPLVPMHPVAIQSRDDLELVSYLTLPPATDRDGDARPEKPVPLVLFVHGGPWARDNWGYNPYHQWLANRGYAVLAVNFRGSTGLGKLFVNAGDLQWGANMHNDLIDAVNWAIREKIADPDKVAIMGGSYGGYAVLWGLTNTPKVFACGVDIVGPSNLVTLLESIPPYWRPLIEMFTSRVGDHRTAEGREFLLSRSPIRYVKNIERPLLIGQGANDPRVKQAESDRIVEAMQKKNIPVTYVLFPDEGHGFARPTNRMAFNAVAEAFLAQHLGGRVQPIGNDFEGSSLTVPAGAGQVPTLAAALPEPTPGAEEPNEETTDDAD